MNGLPWLCRFGVGGSAPLKAKPLDPAAAKAAAAVREVFPGAETLSRFSLSNLSNSSSQYSHASGVPSAPSIAVKGPEDLHVRGSSSEYSHASGVPSAPSIAVKGPEDLHVSVSSSRYSHASGVSSNDGSDGVAAPNPVAVLNKIHAASIDSITRTISYNGKEFKVGKILGQGAFGKTYLVTDSDGKTSAIKVLDKSNPRCNTENLIRESRMQAKVTHPHVVTVHEMAETDKSFLIRMDLASGCEAEKAAKGNGLPPAEFQEAKKQLLSGLKACHAAGVYHHDLKPENLLWDAKTKTLKIIDFGFAKEKEEMDGVRYYGTPIYMDVELGPHSASNADAYDSFALGVTLMYLKCGHDGFDVSNKMKDARSANRTVFDNYIQNTDSDYPLIHDLMFGQPRPTVSALPA